MTLLALVSKVIVSHRVVSGGGLDEAGKEGRLSWREVLGVLAEVSAGGGPDPISAVAVVHAVHVHGQDLILREPLLEGHRKHHLVDLALDRLLRRQELDLHQLLRDGAAALVQTAGGDVDPQGSQRRADIDAAVVVEVAVLGRQRRAGASVARLVSADVCGPRAGRLWDPRSSGLPGGTR